MLFLLSLSAFTASMLYAFTELQDIQDDIFALNAYYLPLAEEGAQLDSSIRQLSREHERYTDDRLNNIRRSPPIFLIQQIQSDTNQAKRLHKLARKDRTLRIHARKNADLFALIKEIQETANNYESQLKSSEADALGGLIAQLDRDRSALNIRIGQFNSQLSDQTQELSKDMARSQRRTVQIFSILAFLVLSFTTALAFLAARVIRPIETLTATVQRIRMGEYEERIHGVSGLSGTEVQVLSQEINAMADAVAERNTALFERAQVLDGLSERLQKVLDHIPIGIILLNESSVEMCNPIAQKQWGIKAGSSVPDFLDRQNGTHRELKFAHEIFNMAVTPFGASGRLISTENITARVNDRESLARAQRLALIGRMLAQITHEVRNPLNAMSLNAEMLEEELSTEDGREMLDIISKEIHRLEQTTERYLALTRKRAPVLTIESIDDLVGELVQLETPSLHHDQIKLTYQPLTQALEIDRESLLRTLRNLVRNAREAHATHIQIKAGERTLLISDDGEGIDTESAEHIFDPFFTTKSNGTGLGLAICRQELEEWGASLDIIQSNQQGSQFKIALPYQKDIRT